MIFKSELANKYFQSFVRTGDPCFYILATDFERTEILRQQVQANVEDGLTL